MGVGGGCGGYYIIYFKPTWIKFPANAERGMKALCNLPTNLDQIPCKMRGWGVGRWETLCSLRCYGRHCVAYVVMEDTV